MNEYPELAAGRAKSCSCPANDSLPHVARCCALRVARCTLRLRRPQPKPKHRKNVAAENKNNAWPAKKGGEGAGGTEEGVGGGEEEGAGGGGGNKPKAAKQTEKEHNKKTGEIHEEFNLNKQTATAEGVAHATPLLPNCPPPPPSITSPSPL